MHSLEKFKQSKLSAIQVADQRIKRYQEQKLQNPSKADKYDSMIALQQQGRQFQESQLSLARPENPEDMQERVRIRMTYDKTIAQTVSDDNPVFFHGVKNIAYLEPILSSGRLGYQEGVMTSSFTSPGTLDVTTKDSIKTSLGFMGLEDTERFIPAGCMFVIAPKDEREEAYAKEDTGTEHSIETVYFKKNPERIVAIVSTNENQEYIKGLCQKYGISTDKVCTFDGFIERIQQERQKTAQGPALSITDVCRIGHEKHEMRRQVVQARREDALKR